MFTAFSLSKSGYVAESVKLEIDHPFYYQLKLGDFVLFSGVYAQ